MSYQDMLTKQHEQGVKYLIVVLFCLLFLWLYDINELNNEALTEKAQRAREYFRNEEYKNSR